MPVLGADAADEFPADSGRLKTRGGGGERANTHADSVAKKSKKDIWGLPTRALACGRQACCEAGASTGVTEATGRVPTGIFISARDPDARGALPPGWPRPGVLIKRKEPRGHAL